MPQRERKIAVVLIHGIGDQKPMASLRGFTSAVLRRSCIRDWEARLWSKPDDASGSFELRRLSVTQDNRKPRIDFYEFYWAHLMQGNALHHTLEWLNNLLFRSPSRVPPRLRSLWWLCWVLLAICIIPTALFWQKSPAGVLSIVALVILLAVKYGVGSVLRKWVGDAARYFNPKPHNVAVRNAIRMAGVDLLGKLHDSGKYRRIVLVGHSLGSAIALDIIYHYWIQVMKNHDQPDVLSQTALKEFESALNGSAPLDSEKIREYQKRIWQELCELGFAWRITDLITLGSPLTHLPFLTGLDHKEFADRLRQRELPMAPPVLDNNRISYHVNYRTADDQPRTISLPHHAACFAATRWTNIYFLHDSWFAGDAIGGPLAEFFGPGVRDMPVKTAHWGGYFNHIDYWRDDPRDAKQPDAPLEVLMHALSLTEDFGRRSSGT